jgi:peptidyl-prolyl cis-trans isomerase B (cyclophilin B)
LYPNEAQMTVANFVNLCRHHYYDGLTWHYVQPAFKISTGDPAQATKSGSLGYTINHEFSRLSHDSEGCVSMSAAELHTVDSMFFITLAAMPGTDLKYSMFGRVVQGMDVVRAVQLNDRVDSITIEGDTKWLMLDYAPEIATWDRILEGNLRNR